MNCGIYCLIQYFKEFQLDLPFDGQQEEVSMLDLIRISQKYHLHMNGYYHKKVFKNAPYILYLPKHKHFMFVRKIGWLVHLCDPQIGEVSIPYPLYCLLYKGYYLKIDENSFRQEDNECV